MLPCYPQPCSETASVQVHHGRPLRLERHPPEHPRLVPPALPLPLITLTSCPRTEPEPSACWAGNKNDAVPSEALE